MKNESSASVSTPVSGENETLTRFESTTASEERWLPIPRYEGLYEVSDLGRVCSFARGRSRLLRQNLTGVMGNQYPTVTLYKHGSRRHWKVHALVLQSFKGHREKGMYACHNDGDRMNSRLDNLRWDTPSGNTLDKKLHGTLVVPDNRGTRCGTAKLTEKDVASALLNLSSGVSTYEIARTLGVSRSCISSIKGGRTWKHLQINEEFDPS